MTLSLNIFQEIKVARGVYISKMGLDIARKGEYINELCGILMKK